MNRNNVGNQGVRKRSIVLFLWSVVHVVFTSSSANCFAPTTNAASTPNNRRHHYWKHQQQQSQFSGNPTNPFSLAQMVASTPPRGGSSTALPPHSIPPEPTAVSAGEPSRWTKIRRTIFPIHGKHEVTKFLLIGAMKFFIILALTLTRDAKDTLVVTQCGAEAIAFLKVGHHDDTQWSQEDT